jgi:hypothetical protein
LRMKLETAAGRRRTVHRANPSLVEAARSIRDRARGATDINSISKRARRARSQAQERRVAAV